MNIELQLKFKNNPNYLNYLRNNSYWYKILNRDPKKYNEFVENYKEFNRKEKNERISKTLDYIEMLTSLMSNLK